MTDRRAGALSQREVSLVEILDRALNAGVVITGDLTISLADVDLLYLDLRLLLGSVSTIRDEHGEPSGAQAPAIGRGDGESP
jgi:gas vesicle structural protein